MKTYSMGRKYENGIGFPDIVPVENGVGEFVKTQDVAILQNKLREYEAYLRTLANFGGTLTQSKELAQKALREVSV